MKLNENTLLTSLGVVLFSLAATGCYTSRTLVPGKYTEFQDNKIKVELKNGTFYDIEKPWIVDSLGNITGVASPSESWKTPEAGRPPERKTFPADSLVTVTFEELDELATAAIAVPSALVALFFVVFVIMW